MRLAGNAAADPSDAHDRRLDRPEANDLTMHSFDEFDLSCIQLVCQSAENPRYQWLLVVGDPLFQIRP